MFVSQSFKVKRDEDNFDEVQLSSKSDLVFMSDTGGKLTDRIQTIEKDHLALNEVFEKKSQDTDSKIETLETSVANNTNEISRINDRVGEHDGDLDYLNNLISTTGAIVENLSNTIGPYTLIRLLDTTVESGQDISNLFRFRETDIYNLKFLCRFNGVEYQNLYCQELDGFYSLSTDAFSISTNIETGETIVTTTDTSQSFNMKLFGDQTVNSQPIMSRLAEIEGLLRQVELKLSILENN